jgi:hypothetical protein
MASSEIPAKFHVSEQQKWRDALASAQPVLVHLNADTTWLVQLPYPSAPVQSSAGRAHYNVLIDPWLQGTQSDYVSWFSTQWHVVAPIHETIKDLEAALRQIEGEERGAAAVDPSAAKEVEQRIQSCIDAIIVSHEFTDHCHRDTLLQLAASVPVFATEKAAVVIRSWKHFHSVESIPAINAAGKSGKPWLDSQPNSLPSHIRLGRSTTSGDAGLLHSAVVIAFSQHPTSGAQGRRRNQDFEAIIYSPHGIKAANLQPLIDSEIKTLALLHGLSDIRLGVAAQLNLGAMNGIQAARKTNARYWIATHDEQKAAKGLVSWVLKRKTYTLNDAVAAMEAKRQDSAPGAIKKLPGEVASNYRFIELGSGDAQVLA